MSRNTKEKDGSGAADKTAVPTSNIHGGSSGAPPAHLPTLVEGNPIIGSVSLDPDRTSPTVQYARVRNGGYTNVSGVRTPMRAGKLVNNLNYDFKKLRSEGIVLDPEPDPNTQQGDE